MLEKVKLACAGMLVVGGTCVGCYYYGQYQFAEQRYKELEAHNKAQEEYMEQLKAEEVKYEKFINTVNNETELVLFTEEGITNTVIERGKNIFTHTETEFAIEYRVKLGLKTSNIKYYKGEKGMNVVIDREDIEVNSIEVINKNILISSKKLFGKYMNDDEKIAAEKLIIEKAKEEVLSKNNIDIAIDGFSDYMRDLEKTLDLDLNIIIE